MNDFIEKIRSNCSNKKYTKWYINICERGLQRTTKKYIRAAKIEVKNNIGYIEGHHIWPQCLCSESEKKSFDNYSYLTSKEHFICHLLLCKMFNDNRKYKMFNAIGKMMKSSNNQNRYSSRNFELAKRYFHEFNSLSYDEKYGVEKSRTIREKLGISLKGKKQSKEHLAKRIISLTGKSKAAYDRTDEHCNKISNALKGKHKSDSHKEALRQANLGKPSSRCSCLLCKKELGINNFKQHLRKLHQNGIT